LSVYNHPLKLVLVFHYQAAGVALLLLILWKILGNPSMALVESSNFATIRGLKSDLILKTFPQKIILMFVV